MSQNTLIANGRKYRIYDGKHYLSHRSSDGWNRQVYVKLEDSIFLFIEQNALTNEWYIQNIYDDAQLHKWLSYRESDKAVGLYKSNNDRAIWKLIPTLISNKFKIKCYYNYPNQLIKFRGWLGYVKDDKKWNYLYPHESDACLYTLQPIDDDDINDQKSQNERDNTNTIANLICTGTIKECQYLTKINMFLGEYKSCSNTILIMNKYPNMIDILNQFNHLVFKHNNNNDIEYISKSNKCVVIDCKIIRRQYRDRNLNIFINECKNNDNDVKFNVFCEFIDKIHCYVSHYQHQSLDNNIINTNIQSTPPQHKFNQLQSSSNFYNFGEAFYYWDWYKHNDGIDLLNGRFKYSDRYVAAKYNSFKEETLNNDIVSLSTNNWNNEYEKAVQLVETDYCKNNLFARIHSGLTGSHYGNTLKYGIEENAPITINHLIGVMMYCNYTNLSYQFSKTFRMDSTDINNTQQTQVTTLMTVFEAAFPSKSDKNKLFQLKQRNRNFYYLSRNIHEAVNVFSTKNTATVLYHGVGEESIFDSMCWLMYQPFSTTTEEAVAKRFSNDTGMILTLKYDSHLTYCTGFDCSWVSNFGNEREYLFMSTPECIIITNITNISTAQPANHEQFIKAICMLEYITHECSMHSKDNINVKYEPAVQYLLCKMIKHELSRYKINKKYNKMVPYIDKLFHNICIKKTWLLISYPLVNAIESMKSVFCYANCGMINLDKLLILFPNLKMIELFDVPQISKLEYENVLKFTHNYQTNDIFPAIILSINQKATSQDQKLINDYKQQFRKPNWFLSKMNIQDQDINAIIEMLNIHGGYLNIAEYVLILLPKVNPDSVVEVFGNPQMLKLLMENATLQAMLKNPNQLKQLNDNPKALLSFLKFSI